MSPVRRFRIVTRFARVVSVIFLATVGAAPGRAPIRPEPQALERATPKLFQSLRADPYDYFRFVNQSWIARVCSVFRGNPRAAPVARLHGDAHLEQFAVTNESWGLDDFDDSAHGPAAIDIVRFLGSVDLVARQRSWSKDRDVLFDRFFGGYRRGFMQPGYVPPLPDVVQRFRSEPSRDRTALLEWGETKMEPMADVTLNAVIAAVDAFTQIVVRENPDLAPGYFRVLRAGWFTGGVGSAVNPKILVRVRGRSDDPADNDLLEVKKIGDLAVPGCLETPTIQPAVRIIGGSKQIGRLKYRILAAGPESLIPEVEARGQRLRDWWIHSLDPSYREVSLKEIRSVRDLGEIVYDAGAQLGAGHVEDEAAPWGSAMRKQTLAAILGLEKQYRSEATTLVDDLFRGWRELRAR